MKTLKDFLEKNNLEFTSGASIDTNDFVNRYSYHYNCVKDNIKTNIHWIKNGQSDFNNSMSYDRIKSQLPRLKNLLKCILLLVQLENCNYNGYKIIWNGYQREYQVSHENIGFCDGFKTDIEAFEYCLKG